MRGDFVLTLWTSDPELAGAADRAGVQRIGLDLERLGKARRQRGLGTWISPHRADQLPEVRRALRRAEAFVRVNPLHPGTAEEVEELLELGAQVLMLPMFHHPSEVERFAELVGGRATVVPLIETPGAARLAGDLVRVPGVREAHIGINDLALGLGTRNRFEVLQSPLLEQAARVLRHAGWRVGIGALGLAGDRCLPVPSDLLYARYVELGSDGALLARSFTAAVPAARLAQELARSRRRLNWWRAAAPERRRAARGQLRAAVATARGW